MLSIPITYFLYKSLKKLRTKYYGENGEGSAFSLGYPSNHPVQKFVKPHLSYWDRFRIYVATVIHSLLTDPSIEKEGLNFLDKTFRHKQTQEAGLSLLNNVLQDDRFMKEAQVFGSELIADVIA